MATTSQKVGEPSAHSVTTHPNSKDMKQRLAKESFERILDILQQISLHEKSPKLFIIYAHENKSTGFEAYQETVKEYISWFKKIGFNVDSDRSPHGYGVAHGIGHQGASNDIFTNQVCLLPRTWHQQNVDYVLVFYSKVLASYMKFEREFKIEDITYSDAIYQTCEEIQHSLCERSQQQWTSACDKIRTVQQRYSRAMNGSFHHVLTETALLSFTNRNRQLDRTIPIIISGDEEWEPELEWQARFVHNKETQLRLTIKPGEDYQQFFKILPRFETLERDRPAIDVMMKCFQASVKSLERNPRPEMYRSQLEIHITEAMQNLNRRWQKIERPITRADIRGRLALHSKLDVASIQRVSGERFAGGLNDIELAMIESTVPRNWSVEQEVRESRQNVSLHNIFDRREINHKMVRPKRVLIQGKPGIGKTTFCRRLMYEYLWNKDLRTKFDLVVRIPARKLDGSVDLRRIFFEEYFEDAPNGQNLSEVLENLVLAHENVNPRNRVTSSRQILLILDGLDEIMIYSQGKHTLLEKLTKGAAVIITSRHHDIKIPSVTIELHLEALGLSSMSVDAYLDDNTFVAEKSARQIRHFIEGSAFVKDMIRVPIHLDIFCHSWDQLYGNESDFDIMMNDGETSTPTITTLYQSVVRSLWRQDIPVLDKMDHGERMTAETINAVQDIARLDRLVKAENDLLEELAFKRVRLARTEFIFQDVANVIRHWESNGNQVPLSLESRVLKFSLLRSSSRKGYRVFRFIHLTFQDFFAARYIVHSLVQGPSQLRSLLRQHKYNRQYKLLWRFIPGLLTKVKDLELFFQLLDEEPRDLLGIQHVRLVMHCCYEWPAELKSRRWGDVVKKLEDWQELECRMRKSDGIGSSMEFPEVILHRKLEIRDSKNIGLINKPVLDTICERTSLSELLIGDITKILYHKRLCNEVRALKMPLSRDFVEAMQNNYLFFRLLGPEVKLPDTTIYSLLGKIREDPISTETKNFAYHANRLLEGQYHPLPDKAVKELEEWFRSEELPLARIANRILKAQSGMVTLSKETFEHAVQHLIRETHGDKDTKEHTWALQQKGTPSESVTRFLAWLLQKGRMVSRFCYPELSLQPVHLEKICRLLYMCLRHGPVRQKDFESLWCMSDPQTANDPEARIPLIEIKRTAVFALHFLQRQPSLPANVLKRLVLILNRDSARFKFDSWIQNEVHNIIRAQPELHDDVIVYLRNMFRNNHINNNRKHAVVAALGRHLQLIDEAYSWALDIATNHLRLQTMESQHAPEILQEILEVLSVGPDLPESFADSLVYSFPKLHEEKIVHLETLACLLNQQRRLSIGVVEGMVKILKSTPSSGVPRRGWVSRLCDREVLTEFLVDALCRTSDEEEISNLMDYLDFKAELLDKSHLQYLRKRLDCCPCFPGHCRERLDRELVRQVELHGKNVEIPDEEKSVEDISWRKCHLEQFVTRVESLEPHIVVNILKDFLYRSAEDMTPVYIDGNILHYEAAYGEMKQLQLKDEQSFRERFREAQRLLGYPPWSYINQFSKDPKTTTLAANRVNPKG
ncbi:MAG: hypothetical protein Q9180_002273 [Flavoplaca navasiana]